MARPNRGSSLVEVLVGVTLLLIFAFSLYTSLTYILNTLGRASGITTIHSLLTERSEFIRNLNYNDIGIIGGVPNGLLSPTETYIRDGRTINLSLYVRNINDPYDANPIQADYKLIELQGVCLGCPSGTQETLDIRVAPKGLASSSGNGALYINVFNALGVALSNAAVSIINNLVSPAISINDVTDSKGFLRIIDTPTSTQGYQISVTEPGYSTDKTYLPNDPSNPNPIKPYATVVSGQITSISFSIDALSNFSMTTTDYLCRTIPNVHYNLSGTKLIGTAPNILKFATSSMTSATGTASYALEWDNYNLTWIDPNYVISGLTPYGSSTLAVNPNTALQRKYVVTSSSPDSLLVTVIDSATSNPIPMANITLTKIGQANTATTGIADVPQSDWSGGKYTDKNGIGTDVIPGSLSLLASGGVYSTTTTSWLISTTIDFGTTTMPQIISFGPVSQPALTTVQFQIASNNNNATWNFIGPDGTNNSYYTATSVISADHANKRFLRYKAYMSTLDQNQTPTINNVTISFSGGCVPAHQKFFPGLSAGAYDLLVQAPGYNSNDSSVSLNSNAQEAVITMVHI